MCVKRFVSLVFVSRKTESRERVFCGGAGNLAAVVAAQHAELGLDVGLHLPTSRVTTDTDM